MEYLTIVTRCTWSTVERNNENIFTNTEEVIHVMLSNLNLVLWTSKTCLTGFQVHIMSNNKLENFEYMQAIVSPSKPKVHSCENILIVQRIIRGILQKISALFVSYVCTQMVVHGSRTTNLKSHLWMNHCTEFDKLYEDDMDKNQSLMETFVQPTGMKKLPHDSTCAVNFMSAVVDFIMWELSPVQVPEHQYTILCRRTITSVMETSWLLSNYYSYDCTST